MIRTSEVRAADFLMRFDAALFEQGCTDMEFRTKLVLSVAPIVMKMAMNGVIKLCRYRPGKADDRYRCHHHEDIELSPANHIDSEQQRCEQPGCQ